MFVPKRLRSCQPRKCHDLARGANGLIERSINAERAYLVGSWLDPVGGHDAAVRAGLNGADFTSPTHSFIFAYIALNAEHGRRVDADEMVAWSHDDGDVFLDYSLWSNILLATQTRHDALAHYAETVADYAHRRRRASACLREAYRLIGAEPLSAFCRPTKTTTRRRTGTGPRKVSYV